MTLLNVLSTCALGSAPSSSSFVRLNTSSFITAWCSGVFYGDNGDDVIFISSNVADDVEEDDEDDNDAVCLFQSHSIFIFVFVLVLIFLLRFSTSFFICRLINSGGKISSAT